VTVGVKPRGAPRPRARGASALLDSANKENGAGRPAHDLISHAAEQRPSETAPAVGGHGATAMAQSMANLVMFTISLFVYAG
jgi:hypothetical protein